MNTQIDLDRRLRDALDAGPSRAPERSIDTVLAHARAHPRRRDPLAILRKDPMNAHASRLAVGLRPLPLVAALTLVVAGGLAVATAGGFLRDQPAVVPPIVSLSPATPSASPIPSARPASPAVVSVDLLENVGADATIDISDLSGRLIKAESGDPGDGASVPVDSVNVTGLAGNPAAIVLTWSGLPCDTGHRLTIGADGLTMAIERPACQGDALGVDHVLVLMFDDAVDPGTVNATIRTIEG